MSDTQEKIAVFGGTFNPIHSGHIKLCKSCCEALEIDRAILMPANLPPHKMAKQLASNEDRFAMCQLAAQELPYLEVSDLELNAGGKSYTVLTMQKLAMLYPQAKLYFVMGTDMFLCFDQWYRWQEILDYCDLAVSKRNPSEEPLILQKQQQLFSDYPQLRQDCVHIVSADCIAISSTQLRQMLQTEPKKAEDYLPKAVYQYIKAHHLYKGEK